MKSTNKNLIFIFLAGLIIGMMLKFSLPFGFFNFGWAKVFNIKNLNYTSDASIRGQNIGGGACSN
jgi:hypothetical protein